MFYMIFKLCRSFMHAGVMFLKIWRLIPMCYSFQDFFIRSSENQKNSCGQRYNVLYPNITEPGFPTCRVWLTSVMLLTVFHYDCIVVVLSLCVWKVRGVIYFSSENQDLKMGSCDLQCDILHKWISQRLLGPMYQYIHVYCDGVECHVLWVYWDRMGHHFLCLRHAI